MQSDGKSKSELAFTAALKEAELLRAEILLCVANVRRQTIIATYIAGFALPLVGGLLRLQINAREPITFEILRSAFWANSVPLMGIGLGVSLTCLALLSIYLGTFRQIFNIARYFREVLVPDINTRVSGQGQLVLQWEAWLQQQRASRSRRFSVGDADLAAEPILISLYTILYCALFVFAAVSLPRGIFIAFALIGILIVGYVVVILLSFWKILRDAARAPESATLSASGGSE